MKDSYDIEKPISDLNYLALFIKYLVLFIILFLASWVAVPLFVSNGRSSRMSTIAEMLFDNPLLASSLISVGVIGWFIYRARKKFKFGEVFRIDFNDSEQKLEIKTVNLVNNKVNDKQYYYQHISYDINHTKDSLFGKQTIIKIKEQDKTVHIINIDRTAWCRHERIEDLIEKLKSMDTLKLQ